MSSISFKRDCKTLDDVRDVAGKLLQLEERHLPVTFHLKRLVKRRGEDKNRLLNAHLRDIARWRYGAFTVPDRVFDRVVEDFKGSDVWPRYSDPEPDYYTGEVRYLPKSRADLTDQEISGIVNWLTVYIIDHKVPVHVPEQT